MENGFIKIYRQMTKWEWYGDTNTTRLFLHCLLKANWQDGRFRGVEIPAGSFITSYRKLAKETGLTVRETRTALEHLFSTHELTSEPTHRYTIITVEKWSDFQDRGNQNDPQNGTPVDNQPTQSRHSNGKSTYLLSKEDKEYINNNNNLSSIIDYLTDEQFAKIDETYDDLLELIDLIDDRLRLSKEVIKDPYAYMIAVARNENWPKRSLKS